jgi:Ca-activated chloride channel homolog
MSRPGSAFLSRRVPFAAVVASVVVLMLCSFGLIARAQIAPSPSPSAPVASQDGQSSGGRSPAPASFSSSDEVQVPRVGGRAMFHTGVDVVTLNVTVSDTRDKLVNGLKSGDFAVYEDGVQQDLAFFEASEVPLDLALLLDVSASMEQKLPFVRKAATGFASALRPGDRASVVTFNNRISVAQAFTPDIPAVTRAIEASTASGGTALYNAIYVTLKEFVRDSRRDDLIRRRAMVVLTDGEDTSSLLNFEELQEEARRDGVTIYTIGLRDERLPNQSKDHRYFSQSDYCLKTLANDTGALSFFPDRLADLASAYDSIGHELAGQYALAYTSKNTIRNGAFRRLVVRIVNRPDMRPRTRPGYLADGLRMAVMPTSGTRQEQ